MEKLKPMPDGEKYRHALEMVRLYQKHVLPFVEDQLGFAEMHNLRSIWQAAVSPFREEDNDYDKYIQVYTSWLWIAHCSHNTLAEQLSADEVLEYKRLLLRLYLQQLDKPDLSILRMLKRYTSLAKALLYEMQWITPLEITSCNSTQVTCLVQLCKVRQTSGTDRVCRVDCQNIGTTYARQLFSLKRKTVLSEHGCTISLTPIGV